MKTGPLTRFATIDEESGDINVIVETPRGSRNKLKYDPESGLFLLDKVLPAGASFPHDFGFLPSTVGDDGDPLDVLVLMDEPLYPGNLLRARLIGAIEAEQTDQNGTIRNDRFIAVATESQDYRGARELDDLDRNLVTQIEHFFIAYNEFEDRKFKPIGHSDAGRAAEILDQGRKRFQRQSHRSSQ